MANIYSVISKHYRLIGRKFAMNCLMYQKCSKKFQFNISAWSQCVCSSVSWRINVVQFVDYFALISHSLTFQAFLWTLSKDMFLHRTVQKGVLKCIALFFFLFIRIKIIEYFTEMSFKYFKLAVFILCAYLMFSNGLFFCGTSPSCLLWWHFEKPWSSPVFPSHLRLHLRVQIMN